MKNTILAAAVMLAFVGGAQACENCGGSTATGTSSSGSINNSVAAQANVGNGGGTSYSAAGISASSAANVGSSAANIGGGVAGAISGNTSANVTNGYAYNVSTGSGTGSAFAAGTATSGALAVFSTTLNNCNPAAGNLTLVGSSASSAGVVLAAGTNQGVTGGSVAAGSFTASGSVTSVSNGPINSIQVNDTKAVTASASDGTGVVTNGGVPLNSGFSIVNANSVSNAAGWGSVSK